MRKYTNPLKILVALGLLANKIAQATPLCTLEIPLTVIDNTQTVDVNIQCPTKEAIANIKIEGGTQQMGLYTNKGWRSTSGYWTTWPQCLELKKVRLYGEIDKDITLYAEIKNPQGHTLCKTNKVTLTRSQELITYQQRINEKLVAVAETSPESSEQYKPIPNVQNAKQKPDKFWLKIEGGSALLAMLLGLSTKLKRDDKIQNA